MAKKRMEFYSYEAAYEYCAEHNWELVDIRWGTGKDYGKLIAIIDTSRPFQYGNNYYPESEFSGAQIKVTKKVEDKSYVVCIRADNSRLMYVSETEYKKNSPRYTYSESSAKLFTKSGAENRVKRLQRFVGGNWTYYKAK